MRTLKYFLIKLFLLSFFGLVSFENHAQGLLLDKKRYKNVLKVANFNKKNQILPNSISLLMYTPFAETQGSKASCVGWSIANALSIYNAYKQNNCHRGFISENRYSPAFIYNQLIKGSSCQEHISMIDGLDLIQKYGVCLKKTFYYQKGISCTNQPPASAFQEASKHKLTTPYRRVFQNRKEIINNTKAQIAYGNPVIVGFSGTPKNSELRGHTIWYPEQHADKNNGHAMVVVGYNETSFTLMNSFGETWGKNGFIQIRYQDFEKYVEEAYVLEFSAIDKSIHASEKEKEISVGMEVSVRLSCKNPDSVDFKELPTFFSKEKMTYEIKKEEYQNGSTLKIEVDLPTGINAYLFNIDELGNIVELCQMESSPKDTTIHLPPNPNIEYRLAGTGKEHLCFLFSYIELKNYQQELAHLFYNTKKSIDIKPTLTSIWDGILPKEKINYQQELMRFNATNKFSEGYIVPIIISMGI